MVIDHRSGVSPARIDEATRARALALRDELTAAGLDADADTIHHELIAQGAVLSRSSVWRILKSNDRITSQPHKRPRSSWVRFAAERPNGCWQSDFTHWTLTSGTGVDASGKISLRWASTMLHLGIGRTHARTPVILLLHGLEATVIDTNGAILAEHHIDPTRTYQRPTKTAEPPRPGVQPFTMS